MCPHVSHLRHNTQTQCREKRLKKPRYFWPSRFTQRQRWRRLPSIVHLHVESFWKSQAGFYFARASRFNKQLLGRKTLVHIQWFLITATSVSRSRLWTETTQWLTGRKGNSIPTSLALILNHTILSVLYYYRWFAAKNKKQNPQRSAEQNLLDGKQETYWRRSFRSALNGCTSCIALCSSTAWLNFEIRPT